MRLDRIVCLCVLVAASHAAQADCSCVCVEGSARTVCATLAEAAAGERRCGLNPPDCPAAPGRAAVERYEPPPGASECRSARLLDPSTGSYSIDAKLCRPAPEPPTQ